ncbi:flagellar hook-associated protein 1 FlgK [Jatrophihabitans endophyticus]|uniref:Flagellar hook-associated protein 1 n=1 Tax=Jatrophihabitans endophyticus TaxID=1206085 RepID=A0A1M5IDW9_9ACTN|nr:flagellar hook-associated protein FlgK [Jatrophihabitans endophyticus]SHG26538.1 flagellar hook-associated protein 1 FlgK [Jatrophihabitans endophyticus]
MSNWFAGIGLAGSGLEAARYGLTVVGQNMTNAATVGYTRQTVQQAAVDMGTVTAVQTGRGSLGGVTVTGTARSTDAVLDARVRSEHALGQLADTSASQLVSAESIFGEPSDSGLAAQLDSFWKAWGPVASATTDASAASTRTVLLRDASTVVTTLNSMSTSLSNLVAGTAQSLSADVDTVNAAATQLAQVNGAIAIGTATGASVNSLLDQRDQLLDTLSKTGGATTTIETNGTATVTLGGQTLVTGDTAAAVSVDASYTVSVDGAAATVTSGTMGARIGALTTTFPSYQSSLDTVADALSSTVNNAMAGGYDQNGNAGTAMFSGSGAAGITLAITDPSAVAVSATAGTKDTSIALTLSQSALEAGSADSLYSAFIGNIAASSAAAQQRSTAQGAVSTYVDGLKQSMSGVSIDEEAANMLVYQQAFNASSRVLTAIDSMLDTLINHTGLVGRS